jgi:hypothetical protein
MHLEARLSRLRCFILQDHIEKVMESVSKSCLIKQIETGFFICGIQRGDEIGREHSPEQKRI